MEQNAVVVVTFSTTPDIVKIKVILSLCSFSASETETISAENLPWAYSDADTRTTYNVFAADLFLII